MFGDGAHPEILKRAGPVIIFLATNNCITQEMIDMIWASQKGKHEETVRIVYNLILEVLDYLPMNLMESLFAQVQAVPESSYTEMYLKFIKDFTVRAL
jgi:hypothetical protein